jgi:hypothetical protein
METTVEVSIRAWLPLQHVVPEAPSLALSGLAGLAASSPQLIARIESMWFPSLPGISPWDIAENYAEYLGFRAIEIWAKSDPTSKGQRLAAQVRPYRRHFPVTTGQECRQVKLGRARFAKVEAMSYDEDDARQDA